jgi:hypothetical protein
VFTVTFPKLRLAALTVNWGLGAAVLVPPRATTVVEPVDELLLIVICPLAGPVAIGRNRTCNVTAWPGFSVTGRLPPTIVKPAPVIAAEFTVTGAVPVDVSVNDCVVDVFTVTPPKFRLAALTVNLGLGAAVLVPLKATTTVLPVDELLLIVICPLAAPVDVGRNCTCSVTAWPGFNVTDRLPLTIVKPGPVRVAELTVTGEVPVEVSVNDWVVDVFTVTLPKFRLAVLNVNCGLSAAALVPLRATTTVLPLEELLPIVICPLAAPVDVGRNCTCNVTAWPGFSVTGKLPPTIVKPAPVIAAELTVTGAVPVDVSVNVCVADVFTVTLPKPRLAALTVNWGLGAAVLVPLKATTAVEPVDESLLIVICPLTAPVDVGRNCTCNVTSWPGFSVTGRLPPTIVKPAPVMVAEFTVTGAVPVDVSVNDCVVDVFTVTLPKLRLAALTVNWGLAAAVLVPLRATTAVEPVAESLLIVICPLAAPVTAGLNCTCNVTAWAGFSFTGTLPPTIVKPAPVMVAELTVTGAVPVDVNVNDCVVAVFTVTLPKLRLAVLTANWGLGAAVLVPLRTTTVVEPVDESLLIVICPLAAPVDVGRNCTCNVAAWAGFSVTGTLPLTIVKPAPVMVAELTVTGAVPVDVNVNDCVVAVFTVTLPKLRLAALTANWGLGAAVLVPLRATTAVLPLDELLLIVIWPLAVPAAVGRNCTCSVIDCVGFSVTGKLPPTIVKPVPVIAAELTVTGEVPVDVSVNDWVVAVFTVTLPKLKVAALIVNCGLGAAVLVPLKATTAVLPLDELLLIVICPLAAPVAVGRYCTCSVIDCVGFSVIGKLPPTIAKPPPVIAAELTITGDVPVDVSVNDCVVDVLIVTLPKLRLAALTVNWGLAWGLDVVVPVPVRATAAMLPVDELLPIMICPVAAPADAGSNFTCSVIDWLGFTVAGKLPPTMVKPLPVIATELTVTGDVPVDVSVNNWVVDVLTVTLPKLRLAVLTVNRGLGAVVLVPLRATTAVLPFVELLLIVSCPLAAPVAVGRNCTCRVIDWVGFNVTGRLGPTIVKPAPVIAAEFTVTGDVPVDVSVNDCVVAVFTVTLPKLRLAALTVNWGAPWDDPWPFIGMWAMGRANASTRVSCVE